MFRLAWNEERCWFLGPNGAGKSTTTRTITSFAAPSAGEVSVGGHDVSEDPISTKRLIGYLPESAPVYVDMTVRSFLSFRAELSGLRGGRSKEGGKSSRRNVLS